MYLCICVCVYAQAFMNAVRFHTQIHCCMVSTLWHQRFYSMASTVGVPYQTQGQWHRICIRNKNACLLNKTTSREYFAVPTASRFFEHEEHSHFHSPLTNHRAVCRGSSGGHLLLWLCCISLPTAHNKSKRTERCV